MAENDDALDIIDAEFDRVARSRAVDGRRVLMPDYPHDAPLRDRIIHVMRCRNEIQTMRAANPSPRTDDDCDRRDRVLQAFELPLLRELRAEYPQHGFEDEAGRLWEIAAEGFAHLHRKAGAA